MASKPAKPPIEETLDRVRRIETRITTLCIGLGIETPSQKPVFEIVDGHATCTLPSMDCSMKQVRAAIPFPYTDRVVLMQGQQVIGQLDLADRT